MISRKTFLKSMAGAAVLTGLSGGTAAATPRPGRLRGGVCYDTGVLHAAGDPLSRVRWSRGQLEREIGMVAELRCPSITALGSDIGRLTETTAVALRRGVEVYVQPRLYDHPQEEILEHLVESARQAERLRRGDNVKFVTGCEHFLFTPGIVPGENFMDRIRNIGELPETEWPNVIERFRQFMARAVEVTRREFGGRITYGAADGADAVWNDWSLFDIVGVDYYAYFESTGEYLSDLDKYRQWHKPIMILEFGCCTFTGAAKAGGMGWDIVDYPDDPEKPATVKPGFVRDEREQAEHIARMLDVFGQAKVQGAHLYSFVSPDSPHHPENRDYDFDMASYSLLKTLRARHHDDASPYRTEPKQSFHAVRRHNR
ncbi:abortive phage infection protein [Amycolatopsis albispora]|uniref:Abortive phage infection protein n=1 Tax=Amycolatopsis albispora TaxID=1804986 RepID=A0A344LGH0_9PSEU|nr:abortive phage infection protein [Amycolatopsis albispora]AXB47144.1 hypothetical protein A4R43_35740 [Amycolatopsis albispora]